MRVATTQLTSHIHRLKRVRRCAGFLCSPLPHQFSNRDATTNGGVQELRWSKNMHKQVRTSSVQLLSSADIVRVLIGELILNWNEIYFAPRFMQSHEILELIYYCFKWKKSTARSLEWSVPKGTRNESCARKKRLKKISQNFAPRRRHVDRWSCSKKMCLYSSNILANICKTALLSYPG